MATIEEITAAVEVGLPIPRAEAEALIRSIERRCLGPLPSEAREIVTMLLTEGHIARAQSFNTGARTPCGQDVNDLILTEALDGEDHEITCPQCGSNNMHSRGRAYTKLTSYVRYQCHDCARWSRGKYQTMGVQAR